MRRLAFAATVAALLAVLLLAGRHRHAAPPPRSPSIQSGVPAHPGPEPLPSVARQAARSFVIAFLSYETDSGGPAAIEAIRTHTSSSFSRRLLSDPPLASARRRLGRPRLTALRVDPLPGRPDLALVSGEARRPAGPEPFAFLFARRAGHWVAVGPGE